MPMPQESATVIINVTNHSNRLLFLTNKVNTQILPADNIPYSGIYITKKSNKTLEYANKILTSKNFYEYLCSKGINASGNSIRITARDINEYMF